MDTFPPHALHSTTCRSLEPLIASLLRPSIRLPTPHLSIHFTHHPTQTLIASRRAGLKTDPSWNPSSALTPINNPDLFRQILFHIRDHSALYYRALVSKYFNAESTPFLYRHLIMDKSDFMVRMQNTGKRKRSHRTRAPLHHVKAVTVHKLLPPTHNNNQVQYLSLAKRMGQVNTLRLVLDGVHYHTMVELVEDLKTLHRRWKRWMTSSRRLTLNRKPNPNR